MSNLPALQDLYSDKVTLSKQNDLNILLNQEPNPKWLKDHPFAKRTIETPQGKKKVPIKYIPIERIEYLLTAIFISRKVEIKDTKLIGNSVTVTIRLHYKNPITNEWEWQDGIGAAPLQTDEGAGAIEFDKLKNDAVMKAAPAAKSYAVKDAAEQIGKLFGSDLNRADQIMYDSLAGKFSDENATQELLILLGEFTKFSELDKQKVELRNKYLAKGCKNAQQLIEKRLGELK